jgi:hypothetical protein
MEQEIIEVDYLAYVDSEDNFITVHHDDDTLKYHLELNGKLVTSSNSMETIQNSLGNFGDLERIN